VSSTAAGKPATVGAGQGMPRIARGGALNLLGAVITSITGVVLVIVVTRALPPSEAGIFFALTSLFLLAEMVARLGTSTGLVYFIARFRALGQTDRIRACQRVALIPVVVLSLAMAFVLAFWAPAFARLVGGGEGTRAAVLVLAVVLPVTTLSDTFLSATRGHATMLPTVVLDGITRRTVIDLAKRRGVEVVERAIWPEELESFEQFFLTGSAAEVTFVGSAGPWNFEVGDLSRQLAKDYDDVVNGRVVNA